MPNAMEKDRVVPSNSRTMPSPREGYEGKSRGRMLGSADS